MIRATRKDKRQVIDILLKAFAHDPHARWFSLPEDAGRIRRMRALMDYSFELSFSKGKIYLTEDYQGTALWLYPGRNELSRHLLWSTLKFTWVMGLRRMKATLQTDSYTQKQHTPFPEHVALLFLGVAPEHQGKGLASQLLDPMLKMQAQKNMPVLLETTNPENVKFYQHKGFKVYHQWTLPALHEDLAVPLWFLKKD